MTQPDQTSAERVAPLQSPYHLGYIEDEPGEKFWVIGADGILFAKIPQVDERQAETICAMLNAANEAKKLKTENATLRAERDYLQDCLVTLDVIETGSNDDEYVRQVLRSTLDDSKGLKEATARFCEETERWCQVNKDLEAENTALQAKLTFLRSKGLTVTTAKTSDRPEPYLVYVIEPGSELSDDAHLEYIQALEEKVQRAEAASSRQAATLVEIGRLVPSPVTPSGGMSHRPLLRVQERLAKNTALRTACEAAKEYIGENCDPIFSVAAGEVHAQLSAALRSE
jgi:regulator of replication initiation timing